MPLDMSAKSMTLGHVTRQDGVSGGYGNSSKDWTRFDLGFSSDIRCGTLMLDAQTFFKLLSKL